MKGIKDKINDGLHTRKALCGTDRECGTQRLRAQCRWYIVNTVWTASLGFVIVAVVVVLGVYFWTKLCSGSDTLTALVKNLHLIMKKSDNPISRCCCWGACSQKLRAWFLMIFCALLKIIVHFCFLARLHCWHFSIKDTGTLSMQNKNQCPEGECPKGEFVGYQMEEQTSLCFPSIFWWKIAYSCSICVPTGLHFVWQAEIFFIYPDGVDLINKAELINKFWRTDRNRNLSFNCGLKPE